MEDEKKRERDWYHWSHLLRFFSGFLVLFGIVGFSAGIVQMEVWRIGIGFAAIILYLCIESFLTRRYPDMDKSDW